MQSRQIEVFKLLWYPAAQTVVAQPRSVRLSMSPNSTGMLPVRSLFLVPRRDRVRHRVVVHVEGRHSAHRVSHRSEGADLERVRVRPEPRRQRAARCRGSRLRGGPQARPRVVSCPDVLFPVGEPLTFPVSLSTNGWPVTDVELSARVIEGDTDVSVGQHAFAVVGESPTTTSMTVTLNPNPPKDTDGRREDSGRGWVRELQGRWPGVLG